MTNYEKQAQEAERIMDAFRQHLVKFVALRIEVPKERLDEASLAKVKKFWEET